MISSAAYQAGGGDLQAGLHLLARRYGDWEGVLAAWRGGELVVQFNMRPQPDIEAEGHVQMVEDSLDEYFAGQRSEFGRQDTALLLPVGKPTDTTTQAAFEVLYGTEVACLLIPRSVAALNEQAEEVLKSLLDLAQDATEVGELIKSRDFSQQRNHFAKMTGIDVVAEAKKNGESLEALLQRKVEESIETSLLLPELEKLASQLRPCAFIGERKDLNSDLRYVKDVLAQPLESMKIEVTVPCEMYQLLHLVDMPGLNDTRPWANYNMSQAVSDSTDLLLLPSRNLAGEEATLQLLISSGFLTKQLEGNATGRLVVVHNPEKFNNGLHAADLWSREYQQAVKDNHIASRNTLREWLLKVGMRCILCGFEGTAEALTEEQAKKFKALLKAKLADPSKLAGFVQTAKTFQGSRRGVAEVATMKSAADALEARLRAGWLRSLMQHYREDKLSDAMIASMTEQMVGLLKDATPSLPALRRLCRSSNIMVPNVFDVLDQLRPKLMVGQSQALTARAEEVLQPHREAAADVANVLKHSMGAFSPIEELLDFLKSERVWQLLVERTNAELLRVANNNLLKGQAFDDAIGELLRTQLSAKLMPLSGYTVVPRFARKDRFWPHFQDAVIAALKAVREELPVKLGEQLHDHVHTELFSDDRLFLYFKSWSHGLARQEATRQEADANGEQEHAANAADSAAQGAAPALAAPPAATPGRRGRPKLSRKEQYEQQASLWRALHRFVKDALSIVVIQEKTNAPKRAILLKELELLQEDLEAAVEMYSGGKGYDELCHQMGRSLLHSVLQHKRFAQVLANSPEVSVQAEPFAFDVELVELPSGGWAVQGGTFAATLGDLSLPAGLDDDKRTGALERLQGALLQQHLLTCHKQHAIIEGPDNALKAGYSCLTGRRLTQDSNVKKVRDIIAKQMFEEGQEALAQAQGGPRSHPETISQSGLPFVQKLERTGLLPAPVGQQQALTYMLDFADGKRYSGLLELQELATACLKEDQAFLIWSTQQVDGGRFHAYLLPATPLAIAAPPQRERPVRLCPAGPAVFCLLDVRCLGQIDGTIKAFPMILFGGMVEGVIKPMFAPLFKPPRELYSLLSQGAVQASHHSQGGGPRTRTRTPSGTFMGDSTQPAASTASGEAGPSSAAAAPPTAQGSVGQRARAVKWRDEEDVAAALCEMAYTAHRPRGPPDASDEAGPSKRARR
ncbi:hypothetical protein COHA_005323 [Chlorella ohadii]|uniref:Uncharacterized protein n=1 Tax=Chlorella ohadii TaxID=2649997 RepID=A0AAD5DN55_9CHLO|nr:hypothetical protein COHA_005323 [Chlorella ohadii]